MTPAAVQRVMRAAEAVGETVGVVGIGSGLRACAGGVPVAACGGGAGEAEQLSDLVPGQFLVAGLGDGVGKQVVGPG